MKTHAREEKVRRQQDRARLAKEKQLKEEAIREKEDMERKYLLLQDDVRKAQEELKRSQETTELLAEKADLAEAEANLLNQKTCETEAEIQRFKMSAVKTEEERMLMEYRAREAEMIATKLLEDSERRAKEAEQLKVDLLQSRMAEKMAKERLMEITRSNVYQPSYQLPELTSDITTDLTDAELGGDLFGVGDMDQLSLEIEKERVEYMEKSKHLQDQLRELKTEIEVLKVEENETDYDRLHEDGIQRGDSKYSTLRQAKANTTSSRVAFFEQL
ncbi:merlin [Mytilus galloprovincialis]|uniref:Merlin n=2 Tax=Mytilus TaxID=6548 RepID=A0A8B6FIA4_MYTGA|nr:merlin [Mytilus galloprovincialis]